MNWLCSKLRLALRKRLKVIRKTLHVKTARMVSRNALQLCTERVFRSRSWDVTQRSPQDILWGERYVTSQRRVVFAQSHSNFCACPGSIFELAFPLPSAVSGSEWIECITPLAIYSV